jgi:hypothetical protein
MRGNSCLVLTSEEEAEAWSELLRERFEVKADCRLWLSTWRDVADKRRWIGCCQSPRLKRPRMSAREFLDVAAEDEEPEGCGAKPSP